MKGLPISDRTMPDNLVVLSVHDLIKLLRVRRTTIWKLRKTPDFPKPVMLTPRRRGWRAVDIQRWLEQQIDVQITKDGGDNDQE